ncbi:MAG TPA: AMP-binding protein [Bacilli bacterium]|nr:AMP-binding protein [Bacilli bacterium]
MSGYVHDLLDQAAARRPDHPAVRTSEGVLTYGELEEQTRRLAHAFQSLGVRRGDRVALLLPNGIPVIAALMAASRLGAVYVVINWGTKPFLLRHIVEDAAPRLMLTMESRLADVQEAVTVTDTQVLTVEGDWENLLAEARLTAAPPQITQDLASLIYTSGSTGKPKAVMSTHRNIRFAAAAIQQRLGMSESDVVGLFLPLAFDYGLYQVFLTFQVGATLALGSEQDAGPSLLRKLNEWQVTGLPLVPNLAHTLLRLCKRPNAVLPPLRFVTNTGAHLPFTYIDDINSLFEQVRVYVMFGLTECKRISILDPEDFQRKRRSVGTPLPDTECLIVDESGQPLPEGEVGELVVRGPHVMGGYWNAPEITERRYRPFGDGGQIALFTGDLVSMDEEGFLYFHGRSDDIYKQRGYRVSALEVEEAALDIAGVRQAAVVPGVEEVGTVLFVTGDLTEEAALEQLHRRLEDAKMPDCVEVVDSFPITNNGKTDKRKLAETYLEGRTIG